MPHISFAFLQVEITITNVTRYWLFIVLFSVGGRGGEKVNQIKICPFLNLRRRPGSPLGDNVGGGDDNKNKKSSI